VGCGALRPLEVGIAEVKRMYVKKEMRGRGISVKILEALENFAKEFGYEKIWLETGIMQPEAIGLYEKAGYKRIISYGCYENNPLSVCYEKIIR
jgi:GNAT superfamily N-acetyltransferase